MMCRTKGFKLVHIVPEKYHETPSCLQAVLYFDTATFAQLKAKYFSGDHPSPGYDKQEFNFDWFDPDVRKELVQGDTSSHGHPDYFLGLGVNGKLWLLNDKLLVVASAD